MNTFRSLAASLLLMAFVSSCSMSKEARTYRNQMNGNWQLQTVVSEGITGNVKVQLLNEADLSCFVGSQWNFDNKTSLGYYSISQNAGECVAVKRNIRLSIYEDKDEPKLFQFKKVDNKYKPIEEGQVGYRFTVLDIQKSTMKLRNDVNFEGKTVSFIYNFVRI
jgi:hypothetical protein